MPTVPPERAAVVIVRVGEAVVMVKLRAAVCVPSVAVSVNEYVPAVVGVPESKRQVLRVSPVG